MITDNRSAEIEEKLIEDFQDGLPSGCYDPIKQEVETMDFHRKGVNAGEK